MAERSVLAARPNVTVAGLRIAPNIVPLRDAAAVVPFLGMTYPRYQPLLRCAGQDDTVIAFGARHGEEPVGLILAELPPGGSAKVVSLYVAPRCRGRGLGSALLAQMEAKLAERGCPHAWLSYPNWKPATASFERVLQKRGWSPPEMAMLHLRGTTTAMAQAPWIRFDQYPADFTSFPWAELSASERQSIDERQRAEPWMPRELVPWRWEAGHDPAVSLGLRYRREVVGWFLVHPAETGTIRFSSAWIRPDLQGAGRQPPLLPLGIEILRRAIAAGYEFGTLDVSAHQTRMLHFTRRWLLPVASSCTETRTSWKALASPALAD